MDKKPAGRGVVDSIYALRLRRYLTRGPGAKREQPTKKASVAALRDEIAKVATVAKKKKSKKAKKGRKSK